MTDERDVDLEAEKEALQALIWRGDEPLEPVLDRAMRVVVAASRPEHANHPMRPCVHEDLLLVHQMMDFPGYAAKIERIAATFAAEIPTSSQCHACMAFLAVQALIEQGRLDEAELAANRATVELPRDDSFATECRRLDLVTALCEVAYKRGDAAAIRARLPAFAKYKTVLSMFNATLAAWAALCELFIADLEDDVHAAASRFAEVIELTELAQDVGLRAARALARLYARAGQWARARELAERAAEAARGRDALRFHAELRIVAIEACRELGALDEAAGHARTLSDVVPRLKTRDLDERARTLAQELGA